MNSFEQTAMFESLENRLFLSLTPALTAATAVSLQPNVALDVDGTLSTAGELDAYKFVSPAKGTLNLTLSSFDTLDSTQLDLYDSNGTSLASSPDGQIIAQVADGQTYYVQASSPTNQTGGYSIEMLDQAYDAIGGTLATAKNLKLGSSGNVKTNGTIDYGTDVDVYKVTASKSGVISATVTNTASVKTMIPQVAILDAQGNVISSATATAANTTATATAAAQAGSVYYVKVTSGNQVGNTYNLSIKNATSQSPVMQAIAPVTALEGTPISFTVQASDPNGLPLTYSASNLPQGATFDANTHIFNWTPATGQAGTYSPTFTVNDGQLSASQTASLTVTAATPTHTDTIGGWSGASQNLTVDANGNTTYSSWIDTASDTDMFKYVATKTGTLTVNAEDSSTSPTMLPRVNFYDANCNQAASNTATSATAGATLTYNVTAGQTYYIKVLSDNGVVAPYTLTAGLPAATNQAPVMQAIPAVTAQEGQAINFTVSASDPDGNPLTYTASNLPTGSTFNASTHAFAWTPATGQAGTYSPVFTVSDGSLTASQTAGITVTAASTTPTHTDTIGGWSGKSQVLSVDASGSATYSSWMDTAADQDMFKYVASKSGTLSVNVKDTSATPTMLPRVNFYDANSNQVATNTAPSATAGATLTYAVTAGQTYYIKVLSDNGVVAPYTLTASMAAAPAPTNQAPVMQTISPVNVVVNTPIQFTVTASDANNDPLTYSATNLPTGSTFDTNTHVFSWTPAATGTFSPVFTVSDGQLTASQTASITVSSTSTQPPSNTTTNDLGKMGQGGTTATYIDPDNDGYGINAPKGPDADNNDPNVNTYAQALAKYGSTTGILNHLGYTPLRIFYVSNSGSNSTGVVNDINHPYADWNGVDGLVKPGDAVVFRAGTYNSGTNANDAAIAADTNHSANGTAANPIVVMGMPGERVVLHGSANSAGNRTYGIWYAGDNYVFDNFETTSSEYMGAGVKLAYNAADVVVRNINTHDNSWGVQVNGNWHDLTFENIVSHDNRVGGGEHGIYLGSSAMDPSVPCYNAILRGNVIFNNGNSSIGQGIHANGIMTNVLVENNIIHDNGTSGIDLMNGVRNSVFRNNVIFSNSGGQPFIISNYSGGATAYTAPMDNNLIENNTMIATGYISGRQNDIRINVDSAGSVKGLVIRNNVLYMDNVGSRWTSNIQFDNNLWVGSTTIENNVVYNLNNTNFIDVADSYYNLTQGQSLSSLFRNNIFTDPKFISYTGNLSTDNFDLLSSSPAINLGLLTGAPATDIRGDARVGAPDAGAYEYH